MFQATGSNIIVRIEKVPDRTNSGLLLIDEIDPTRDAKIGYVVSIGENVSNVDVAIGDKVSYRSRTINKNMRIYNPNEWGGEDGEIYCVIGEQDVIGIYENEEVNN